MSELIMEGVCYRYPGTKKEILTGVDAVFRPGTVHCDIYCSYILSTFCLGLFKYFLKRLKLSL